VSRRQFRIIKEIAEGGFGRVYLAELISADQQFSRVVAFKLLHERWATHDEVLSRTRDEARLLGLLRNDHIVKVEDLTSINGQCAIVMEYLEGVDLKWLIQFLAPAGRTVPLRSLFEIVQAAADALSSAYNGVPLQYEQPLRVIHRDIKPSNILVTTTGQVKVLDFGTARANFAKREARTQELAFGSQGYMAPERVLGGDDTPAADVFSLGITMYEVLALENFGPIPPRPQKYNLRLDERIAGLSLAGPELLTERARDFLHSMLAYYPDDRPSAERVVEVMEQLASEAEDMPLRKFGRTVVVEAREAMPAPEKPDTLVGSIVQEDISASRPLSRDASAGDPAGPALPPTLGSPRPDAPPLRSTPPERPRVDAPTPPGSRRLVLALSLLGGLGLAAVLLVVIGVAVYVIIDILGNQGQTPFVVESAGRPTEARVQVTLTAEPADRFVARLQGDQGFLGTWTGPTPVTLELPAGTYSTSVRRQGAEPIRGQTIDLSGTGCAVTLDLTAERWETDCN